MYDIDFRRLIMMLLPPFLRKNRRLLILDTVIEPLKDVYREYQSVRDRYFRHIQYNSVVAVLEMALYEEFALGTECQQFLMTNPGFKFFRIVSDELYHYIYNEEERRPNQYIYESEENEGHALFLFPKTDGRPTGFYDFSVIVDRVDLIRNDFAKQLQAVEDFNDSKVKSTDILKMINEFVWNYRLSGKKFNVIDKT